MSAAFPRLLLVTDRSRTAGRDLVRVVERALAGGVRFVQVREKDLDDAEVERLVRAIQAAAPPGALVAVNGRERIARELGAGLHLPAGVSKPDVSGIRFFGRSAHGQDELGTASAGGAAYVILGNVFPTPGKPGGPGLGLAEFRRLTSVVASPPVYAIGGLSASDAAAAMGAGAHGIAVCRAILEAPDPGAAVRALLLALGDHSDCA